MRKMVFLIFGLISVLLSSCKSPVEPDLPISITLKVEYKRMDSVKNQGDNVRLWFTVFVGDAQYGWYWQSMTNSGTFGEYGTIINYGQAGKWLFYVLDGQEEVARRIFVNGVELLDVVSGKARATISSSGYISSGW